MGFIEQHLPSVDSILSPYLSSLLLPLEQILLESTVEIFSASLATLETMVIVAVVSHCYFILELVSYCLSFPSIFLSLS